MPLTLTITQARGGGERQTRLLSQGTLSIGRASGNDWVLADPDQHLSRTHCMIGFEDGHYWLTDLSTNGMLINGAREPTSRNSRTALTDGDTVQLGGYMLEVAEVEDRAGPAPVFGATNFVTSRADPFGGPGGNDGGNPLNVDPLDDPLSQSPAPGFHHPLTSPLPSMRAEDPFDAIERNNGSRHAEDDLFQGKTPADSWTGASQRDNVDAPFQAFNAPRAIAPAKPMNLDDIDFDALLGDVMPTAAPNPLSPSAAPPPPPPRPMPSGDALDDLLGDFPPPAATPPAAMPPAAVAPAVPVAPAARPQAGDALDDLLGDFPQPAARIPAAPPIAPVPPPAPASSQAVANPFEAPPPAAIPVAPAAPRPPQPAASPFAEAAPATSAAAAPAAALLAAFLDGAGMAQLDLGPDPEAAMRAVGALFRAFVGGTRDVLMSRAEIKHEMRVEQTMIRSRDNNALKFSISAEEALAALLRPNRPGYKSPLASVEEAFTDIRSHEMAVMAGMQTGMLALLRRFDPAGLESRLQRGMLDGILPGARKAKFWELFCATYKDIAREAADDFHAVFGRDFARAYDAQVNKL
jgi:type VI secretion system protein